MGVNRPWNRDGSSGCFGLGHIGTTRRLAAEEQLRDVEHLDGFAARRALPLFRLNFPHGKPGRCCAAVTAAFRL